MKRLFAGIAVATLTLAGSAAFAQMHQNKPEAVTQHPEGEGVDNGAATTQDKVGDRGGKPGKSRAGNMAQTQNPPLAGSGMKDTSSSARRGHRGTKPAGQETTKGQSE